MERLSCAMQLGDQRTRAHQAGQNDLFGLAGDERAASVPVRSAPPLPEWSEAVRLTGERETLGLYLTGHPLARYESSLPAMVSHRIGDLVSERPAPSLESGRFGGGRTVTVAGLVDEVKKRGPRVILTLDDRTGRIEVMLFEETWLKHREVIVKDALLLIEGLLRFDEFSDGWRLSARRISDLDEVRARLAQRLVIRCAHGEAAQLVASLATALEPHRPGPCPITIEYSGSEACGALTLADSWSVRLSRALLEQLESLPGLAAVQVVYAAAQPASGGATSADSG